LRKDETFVEVNCAAIPEDLIESELFGHCKGSFPGAAADKEGKFQRAHGGTLFLDEVGDMSLKTQSKVLRTLEEQRFTPVGGDEMITVDVRVIASTNKDLEEEISRGNFREDLFYRLNVIPFFVPPLRERKEDIPILVRGFLRHFCKQNDKPFLDLAPDAMDALLTYDWPGNVRELRTAIEHGVVMATGPKITLRDLPMAVRHAATATLPAGISPTEAFGEKTSPLDLHETERRLIAQALAATNGNVTAAAKKLGISRRTLHRKINEMMLSKKVDQAGDANANKKLT
jgi:two-component system nitrogen regulation response regulator NtrX